MTVIQRSGVPLRVYWNLGPPQSPDHMELTLEGIEFGISESKNLHKNKPDLSLKTLASW